MGGPCHSQFVCKVLVEIILYYYYNASPLPTLICRPFFVSVSQSVPKVPSVWSVSPGEDLHLLVQLLLWRVPTYHTHSVTDYKSMTWYPHHPPSSCLPWPEDVWTLILPLISSSSIIMSHILSLEVKAIRLKSLMEQQLAPHPRDAQPGWQLPSDSGPDDGRGICHIPVDIILTWMLLKYFTVRYRRRSAFLGSLLSAREKKEWKIGFVNWQFQVFDDVRKTNGYMVFRGCRVDKEVISFNILQHIPGDSLFA